MNLYAPQSGPSSPRPLWVRLAAWCALVVVLFASVAGATHLHRLPLRHGIGNDRVVAAAPLEADSTCPQCTLDSSAVPVQVPHSTPVLRGSASTPQPYTGRAVPATICFALSNRPPPAAA